MIKIAVCDAQKSDRAKIREYCKRYFKESSLEYELQEFTSGESFLETDFPDILFIDTKLESMSGLLVKEILELKHADTRILFVSQTREEMDKAFGKNVYGFFQKPLVFSRFSEGMKRVVCDVMEVQSSFFCKRGRNYEKTYRKDVLYIKSYGRYTKVYVRGEEDYRLSDICIGDWCMEIDDSSFASCHRCFLVNLAYVKTVGVQVELQNGKHLPLSESKRVYFNKRYKEFVRRNSYGQYDEKVL